MSVGTRYVGSTVRDTFEIEFDDEATNDEINDEIEQLYIDFINNEIDGGWNIESDEIIKNE